MRLFGKVDGVIDRYDRAGWLTMPFDLSPFIGSDVSAFALYIMRSWKASGLICQSHATTVHIDEMRAFTLER